MTIENQTAATDEAGFLKTDATAQEPGSQSAPEQQFEAPQKRKRGRPSNAEKMAAAGIHIGSAANSSTAKPRAAKAPKANYTQVDYAAMGKQLVGLHMVVAMATGIPEIQIREEEGMGLAVAIGNVAEQYDLAIDGKTGAMLQLVMTAAMIYGPRALMLKAKAKQAQQQTGAATFEATNGQSAAS